MHPEVRGNLAPLTPVPQERTAERTGPRLIVGAAIVGTTKPDRWRQNAALLGDGRLPEAERERIRARWKAVAPPSWEGQI